MYWTNWKLLLSSSCVGEFKRLQIFQGQSTYLIIFRTKSDITTSALYCIDYTIWLWNYLFYIIATRIIIARVKFEKFHLKEKFHFWPKMCLLIKELEKAKQRFLTRMTRYTIGVASHEEDDLYKIKIFHFIKQYCPTRLWN